MGARDGLHGGEEALGVECGLAARTGGGDGLAVGVVDEVAGREDTGEVGLGRASVDQDVAVRSRS